MGNLKELSVYCMKARLKYIGKDEYYDVPYTVLAEDCYAACSKLEEWLSNPKQTGWKYEECVGIIYEPSSSVLVDMDYIFEISECPSCKILKAENSKLAKSNRNWRRKVQRIRNKGGENNVS